MGWRDRAHGAFAVALITGISGAIAPALASARAPSYYSPGYKGTKKFAGVGPAALPGISLGTGKYPNLLVDNAGTAHLVFATDGASTTEDKINYCTLQRGQTRCAQSTPGLYPPTDTSFPGNFPGGNVDSEGPIPLDSGNQLFIVDRRYPDAFTTPAGPSSDTNVFLWSSDDGGATITGPGEIGTNQMGGGAVVYGSAAQPAIGMISRTETGGTFFQGVPFGQFTSNEAQLGTGDQAYDGGLAVDSGNPIAAFDDTSGDVVVREWSGQGDVNDPSNWSQASFSGYAPQIVGGATGVFVLYSDSDISNDMFLRRISGGQPVGAPLALGTSNAAPAISESPSGQISLAYTDRYGVEVRTSSDGVNFSPPQFTAAVPGGQLAHLETAATADGGGFVTFVQTTSGDVGKVIASAFGSQRATGQPGLGPLPGGGVGSSAGDPLATSTCTSAKFGVVDAEIKAGCFAHDPSDPNLDVSLGEVDINGLRIIPDAGVRIGIDPKLHTIDTTGMVRVLLSGYGLDVTIWHGEIHAKIPVATPGYDLFDFHELTAPVIAGFPVNGDVDVKLVSGGAQVPVSLTLPSYFGGVTGSATLLVTSAGGLQVSSLEFKVGDANFGALELKDVDVSYTQSGNVWKGSATLQVPAGGSALSVSVNVEFDDGAYKSGSFDVGLPYPGVPFDLNDPPPQLFLTHGGLGLGLNPFSLSGTIGFGISPLSAPGVGGTHDYAFSLDGTLSVAFGNPVTVTVSATGYLYVIKVANATLTYKIPDQVTLTGSTDYDLGMVESKGTLSAIVDPKDNVFGGEIRSDLIIHVGKLGLSSLLPANVLDGGDITIPSEAIAINNTGFGVYIPPPGIYGFFGTITYHWGDPAPVPVPFQDVTGQFTAGIPQARGDRSRAGGGPVAHVATTGFTVPRGAPTVSLIVHGSGGAPAVTLSEPNGTQITPAARTGHGATVVALGDTASKATYLGIDHPAPGRWTVSQASGSQIPVTSVSYSIGQPSPTVSGHVSGSGAHRTIHYRARIPANVTITFAEQGARLFHVIGHAHGGSGTIRFAPRPLPAGRRTVVALVSNGGVPHRSVTIGSFKVPNPPLPGRARNLRVRARGRAFAYGFAAPAGAVKLLIRIDASDGRHLLELVPASRRRGSVPVIGFRDRVKITVTGIGVDGRRGPSVSASASSRV
jgi:hypothetical protein